MEFSRAYRRSSLKAALKWVCFYLVLLAICLHVSVKFWLGPAYVTFRIKQTLRGFWSGPVRVGEIDFGYGGIMLVSDISFYDMTGSEVMKAKRVGLVLGEWPSLKAPAKRIAVEHLDVRLRLENGKLNIPVRTGKNPEKGPPRLEYMVIKGATVRIASGKSQTNFDRLTAEVSKSEGLYKLSIERNKTDDSCLIQIDGVFDLENDKANIGLKFAQKTTPEEMKVFLSAMGAAAKWSCYGKLDAELNVRGRLSDVESLRPEGTVQFEDWTILANQRIIGSGMNGTFKVVNRRLGLKILKGAVCGGTFNGSFDFYIRKSGPEKYGAEVHFKRIDMAKLTELAATPRKFTQGTGILNLKLYGDINAPDEIHGYGSTFIDDADLWQIPVIGELFKTIGVSDFKVAGLSDADVFFRLRGPRITIDRGYLSNSLSAIEVEHGGRINLKNRQIDMYVVGLPLKGVEKIAGEIPVLNWFMHIKDKLIRLRLKGNWSDPAGKLISKQPVKDVKEATIGFFVDIVKSGGKITGGLQSALGFGRDSNEPEDKPGTR